MKRHGLEFGTQDAMFSPQLNTSRLCLRFFALGLLPNSRFARTLTTESRENQPSTTARSMFPRQSVNSPAIEIGLRSRTQRPYRPAKKRLGTTTLLEMILRLRKVPHMWPSTDFQTCSLLRRCTMGHIRDENPERRVALRQSSEVCLDCQRAKLSNTQNCC